MNEEIKVNKTRRNLVVATSVAGGVAGVAAAVPFVASMLPSERSRGRRASGNRHFAPRARRLAVIEWRGKPVWIIRRTKEMIESLKTVTPRLTDPGSKSSEQPKYAENEHRSAKPELMVMEGVCTHLGCSPQLKSADAKAEMGADWVGGFYCLPRLQVRLRGARIPRRSGADQPARAALHLRERQHARHRRRRRDQGA